MENIHSSFTKLPVLEKTTFNFIVRNASLDIIQGSPIQLLRICRTDRPECVCESVLETTRVMA